MSRPPFGDTLSKRTKSYSGNENTKDDKDDKDIYSSNSDFDKMNAFSKQNSENKDGFNQAINIAIVENPATKSQETIDNEQP